MMLPNTTNALIKSRLLFCALVPILLSGSGCGQKPVTRHYTEVFIESEKTPVPMDRFHSMLGRMPQDEIHAGLRPGPMGLSQNMPQDDIHAGLQSQGMAMQPGMEASFDQTPMAWKTPSGWLETKGSGMRLATFIDQESTIKTTIVSLGGSAGGLASNVARWMGQINIPAPDNAALNDFIQKQEHFDTKAQWPAVIIDLTQFQTEASDETQSMIAAIVDRGQMQVFVKMTGTKASVLKHRKELRSLVKSLDNPSSP